MGKSREEALALKPCPFCGGPALKMFADHSQYQRLECRSCNFQFPGNLYHKPEVLWNRRASDPVAEALKYAHQQILVCDPKAKIAWLDDVQYVLHQAARSGEARRRNR